MAKKFKTLIFSMTFLTCSAFFAHAMTSKEADHEFKGPTTSISPAVDLEKEKVQAFFSHYNFPDWLRDRVSSEVKGKAFELHKYGVPNLDYNAALFLYSRRRAPEEFGLLFDLFTKTPLENREKIWEDLVALQECGSLGPALSEISYDSNDKLYWSRFKVKGFVSLRDKLMNLPHQ